MTDLTKARVNLHKHYLRGELIATVAESVGDVNDVILAQIGALVESCEMPLRFREELSERTYTTSMPPLAVGD